MQSLRAVARVAPAAGRQLVRHASVLVNVESNGVATLTLSDPERMNALTESLGDDLSRVVKELKTDKSLRAVVLTGAGRAFSAGGDLNFLTDRTKSDALSNTDTMLAFYNRFLSVRTLPVPVIAAINGPAIGAGLCLAGACDMRVAATTATLGWTFATLGLHPGMAATHFTPLILGPQLAARMLLTGEVIDGAEAKRIGLVLEALPKEDVVRYSQDLAAKIAAASPVAVRSCVQSLRLKLDAGLQQALAREADSQAHSYASPDILEGIQAIREKRKPKF